MKQEKDDEQLSVNLEIKKMIERHAATEATSKNKYNNLYSEAQNYLKTIKKYEKENGTLKARNNNLVIERGATITKNEKLEAEKK